ncbi:hypothetical protein BHE74_00041929 [Ensete ventricosum]|nr:hypothetical protein GW17_00012222 [Ensete ventricosum]RWW51699.1 hypothetical protein BHE74_00041929 [Ensete ventricosum]RZR97169.1 hypothetical protein BHM03_00026288 [Ensete ventricosum]
MSSTYRSASRPIRGSPTTRWYRGFSPILFVTGLYQAVAVEVSIVTARYRLVTVNFDHRNPLLGGINLAVAHCGDGRSKRKRENLGQCRPLTARRRRWLSEMSAVGLP